MYSASWSGWAGFLRAAGVRPEAISLGEASSSAKMESALSEPSRLGGAVLRRVMVGFWADLPPKKKFLMDEKAPPFCWGGSGGLLEPLEPSSWARRGTVYVRVRRGR